MNLCDSKEIKALLGRHGFRFSKSMGQNFLIADWVPKDIVAGCGVQSDCGVLEIGPGIGPLTVRLSEAAGKVAAVELDKALFPLLSETLAGCRNVELVQGDILKLDIPALAAEKFPGLRRLACANLPYNITTPVITALLEAKCFEKITVMVQKEVAERICASPGTRAYGAFSVFCQYHAVCQRLFDVSPECFLPAPKVTSSVLSLTPRPKPSEVTDEAAFFRTVRASFAQRRKTLLNGLAAAFGGSFTKEELSAIIAGCGLPADIRGEKLGIPEFAALAVKLSG